MGVQVPGSGQGPSHLSEALARSPPHLSLTESNPPGGLHVSASLAEQPGCHNTGPGLQESKAGPAPAQCHTHGVHGPSKPPGLPGFEVGQTLQHSVQKWYTGGETAGDIAGDPLPPQDTGVPIFSDVIRSRSLQV